MEHKTFSRSDSLLFDQDAAQLLALQAIEQLMQITHYDKKQCMALLNQQLNYSEALQAPLLSHKESEFIHRLFN
ncbi:hypothetical protein [Colwellia sp. RSH04]|uniref:hypothetical protein n=1 Tax=Colwellia sp. RSH04 TaxID=2305464 RepID=UPI000E57FC7E|nr:hypothetical protein [Colwellia sp. RSH04]RHW77473.1 hypothetical protein D1094_00505 [Colwellia sp. RSH04]